MTGFLFTTLGTALSLLIVDVLFRGVYISSFPIALIAAICLGLINSSVRPVLSLLSLPINIVSLGSFSLVVNALCFSLAAFLVPGFKVSGLIAFILAPIIFSLVNTFTSQYFAEKQSPAQFENKV